MNIKKRPFFIMSIVITALLTYSCVSHAAKSSGAYWTSFESEDGSDAGVSSGFIAIDAIDARKEDPVKSGIGPFRGSGPSFEDSDVVFEEEPEEQAPERHRDESQFWKEISVSAGETLSAISEKHGLTIKDIMTANELTDQHKLREGQGLYIPLSRDFVLETLSHVRELKEEAIKKRKYTAPVKVTNYVIMNGDTLWKIANAFDLDVNSLFGSNKISETDVLKVGSTIRVPNQDGVFAAVKSGQTVKSLAAEYGIFEEAIRSANELSADAVLTKGREIFLPGVKIMAFVETQKGRKAVVKEKVGAVKGFGWPVVGKISSSFGWRKDPVRGGRDFHTGLDIRAPRGRQVVASSAGKVVHSGWMGGYGKTVVIQHPGGVTTLYGHCSKLLVKAGTNVRRGERIALVGSTGRSTGNHVHFEVRKGGSPTNPLKVLR
ncbi:MAG: LysM peptidoglycan-binding domain-containing M23 family metallopeptidase [Synergistaceae bacterium]|nr:LysM peptidoglycan-binding domain-containing M23 family metallopeptidase [Synergistaceae bacterium]